MNYYAIIIAAGHVMMLLTVLKRAVDSGLNTDTG